jgi:peptidoglycan/LPS O-acetylase OafA/YrhL
MRSIGDCFDAKRNNFNVLRLAAAILVLFSHSYPLTGSQYEPIYALFGGYDTGGGIAVITFFVISGFLITRSAEHQSSGDFLKARVLRIVPALATVVLIQYLILGPVFTTQPALRYFASGILHLKTAFVFFPVFGLPGVFSDLPIPAVNGSLWTLPVEAFFYLVTGILAVASLSYRRTILIALIVTVAAFVVMSFTGFGPSHGGPKIFFGVKAYEAAKFGSYFYLGGAAWVFRDKIPMHPLIGAAAVVALVWGANAPFPFKDTVLMISFSYIVMLLAVWTPVRLSFVSSRADISYGTYLYAFPVQQTIVAVAGVGITATHLTLLAVPPTLLFAWLSSILIEQPALRLKKMSIARIPVAQEV